MLVPDVNIKRDEYAEERISERGEGVDDNS